MINHRDMVAKLAKPGSEIAENLTAKEAHLLHMAIGVSGEVAEPCSLHKEPLLLLLILAGEMLDLVKKIVIYKDRRHLDTICSAMCSFRASLDQLYSAMELSYHEAIQGNIKKLGKRYKDFTYSDSAAKDRADKTGE